MVHLETRMFKLEEKKIDLGQQQCTDMKTSRRIVFPPARPTKEEVILEVRPEMWKSIFDRFLKTNCKEDGTQNNTQLTKAQEKGKEKLIRRVNKGELSVTP